MITPATREGTWMKRHEEYLAEGARGGIDLLFLGDSITDSWRKEGAESWARHFAPRRAANFGIWGDAAEHLLWRIENGELSGLSPHTTVILIGTNNIPWDPPEAEYSPIPGLVIQAVTQIVQAVRARLPATRIILLGIFPRGEARDFSRSLIELVNKGLALVPGVTFADLSHLFLEGDTIPARLMPDQLHLSAEAYRRWAEALIPILDN